MALLGTAGIILYMKPTTLFMEGKCDDEEKQEWAYPSPYEEIEEKNVRFKDISHLKKIQARYDLEGIVEWWKENPNEECWPWVWTWHNENGPHYVFYGVSEHTLQMCNAISEASPQNNLTLILSSASDEQNAKKYGGIAAFEKARCAIITGKTIVQHDCKTRHIMLSDERIIAFDELHVSR
eukprot:g1611.t1